MLDMLDNGLLEMNPEDRPEIPQILELRKLVKIYKKQRSKLHADQLRTWTELSQALGRNLAAEVIAAHRQDAAHGDL